MRVVILGAGYAGVALSRRLESSLPDAAELVVVDERPTHLVKHQLHRVIRHPSLADVIEIPLDELFDRAAVRTARVEGVDTDARVIRCADGTTIAYDVLAICLGARTNFYGLPDVERHATPLDRLDDAREIRSDFRSILADGGRAVVVGAGLSGVQVAGELSAFAAEEGATVTIELVEQFDEVAPGFPDRFRRAVAAALAAQGVVIHTGTTVVGASADALEVESGDPIPYDQLLWTGGIRGPAALGGERPSVRSDLRLATDAFVVGDAGRVLDANGTLVPASAQTAVREAGTAAENVRKLVDHRLGSGSVFEPRLTPYVYDSPGWLVSVGDDAVAQVGPSVFRGPAARALKKTVGAGYLTSVGAIQNAVELVHEGLGHDDVDE